MINDCIAFDRKNIDSAVQLFLKKDYNELSLLDVASSLDIKPNELNAEFSNVGDIVSYCLKFILRDLIGTALQAVEPNGEFKSILGSMWPSIIQWALLNKNCFRFYVYMREQPGFEHAITQIVDEYMPPLREHFLNAKLNGNLENVQQKTFDQINHYHYVSTVEELIGETRKEIIDQHIDQSFERLWNDLVTSWNTDISDS